MIKEHSPLSFESSFQKLNVMDVQLLLEKQTWGPSGIAEFLTGHSHQQAICKLAL